MDESLTAEIIESVADARSVAPEDLDFVLSEYVDMDAIEQLAAHEGSKWTLTFEIPDQEVTVRNDGTVVVEDSRNEVGL